MPNSVLKPPEMVPGEEFGCVIPPKPGHGHVGIHHDISRLMVNARTIPGSPQGWDQCRVCPCPPLHSDLTPSKDAALLTFPLRQEVVGVPLAATEDEALAQTTSDVEPPPRHRGPALSHCLGQRAELCQEEKQKKTLTVTTKNPAFPKF